MMRIFWLGIGMLALLCGLVGIFVPVLPTVPFLLLATFGFARSSERLHNWLITHPIYGPPIRDWQIRGAISKRAKLFATASIGASLVISALIVPWEIWAIQLIILGCTMMFIWSRPG